MVSIQAQHTLTEKLAARNAGVGRHSSDDMSQHVAPIIDISRLLVPYAEDSIQFHDCVVTTSARAMARLATVYIDNE